MENDYAGLVERWKVNVILDRARKKGFRPDELDDVQQEIIPSVLAFRFDEAKSNDGTERTAITALVDRRLTFIQRGRARQQKQHERCMEVLGRKEVEVFGKRKETPVDEVPDEAIPDVGMVFDVREALAVLTPQEQAICHALSMGENRLAIARTMGIKRCAVDRIIRSIRTRFQDEGLASWMIRS